MMRALLLMACFAVPDTSFAKHPAWDLWRDGGVKAVNVSFDTTATIVCRAKQELAINSIRVQIQLPDDRLVGIAERGVSSDTGVQRRLKDLEHIARDCGVQIVLDLHRPPGGGEGENGRLWFDQNLQDIYIRVVEEFSRFANGKDWIIGFDILNEPSPPALYKASYNEIRGGLQDWWRLANLAIERVRSAGIDLPLVVEVHDYAKAFRFRNWDKFPDDHVVYSFHMYWPFELTHQGVRAYKADGSIRYPGVYSGAVVNRDALAKHVLPVKDFARKHQVPIFVGEFGINDRADAMDRAAYIKDLTEIFRQERWSTAFHAYGLWQAWEPNAGMRKELKK